MSSLSDRLAALNRANERRRLPTSSPGADSPAPKRRADVPTDAPPLHGGHPALAPASRGSTGWRDQARRRERQCPGPSRPAGVAAHPARSAAARAEAAKDRFEDLKESVHSELLQQLGPQLYDANLEAAELESKVRTVLADVMAATNRPLTRGRPGADHPGDLGRHPRLRPARALPARRRGRRGHGQRPVRHLARAQGQADQGRRQVQGRGAPAPHDRQDRLPHRPPRRRVLPHGRRPPARRQPRERRRPAAGDRRQRADHPKVLRRPPDRQRPDQVRVAERPHGRLPRRLRPRAPQRRRLRRYRRRQDHHAERAVVVHPRPTSASSPSRTRPSSS